MTKRNFDIAPYIDIDRPNYRESQPYEPTGDTSGWSQIVISANVLLAVILIVGMAWEGQSIVLSILTGAIYYFLTTVSVIALSSGQAGVMLRTWQQERTERYRIDTYADLAEMKMQLEAPTPTPMLPVGGVQTPTALPVNYVAPYTPEAVTEAWEWVTGLYGRNGQIDQQRVRGGFVQGSVVGSKRGGGSVAALELLKAHRFIKAAEGGYRFNSKAYPTINHAQSVFSQLQERGGWVEVGDTQG